LRNSESDNGLGIDNGSIRWVQPKIEKKFLSRVIEDAAQEEEKI
jgi:hypothetical protein